MTKLIIIIISLLASLSSHNTYIEYGTITESNCITDIHGEMWRTENNTEIPLDSSSVWILRQVLSFANAKIKLSTHINSGF